MSVQAGKFFDVKNTKDYFDGISISIYEYVKRAEIANAEYLNFFSTDAFRGKTAKAVKMLVKNRAGKMLDDAVKAQNLVKDSQDFTLSTFAKEVDPAPNARIEYNTLRNIETDFKGFHNKFKSIALSVENIADRLNGEFGSYGYFGKPDSRPVLREYENFCGGDADNTGYLSECIGKLVRFDGIVNSYITSKQIDVHSTTVSARAKSVGAALMTPVAKSPKVAKYEIKTISTEPVAKSGGNRVNDKYEALQRQFGFTDEEMAYLLEYRPDLLSQLDGVRRFSSSDADKAYQTVRNVLDMHNAKVYGKVETGNYRMSEEEINSNAEYIYMYLRAEGWSKEAICGLLGNMTEESGINPGIWQYKVNGSTGGYGLVQFTGADRKEFYDYMKERDYIVPDGLNDLVENDPKTAINCQLDYLMQSNSWYYSGAFSKYFDDFSQSKFADDMPDKVQMSFSEFQHSTASPACLALIFQASYERSGDTIAQKDERGDRANEWYDYFKDYK